MTFVVAIDPTLVFTSLAAVMDDGTVDCRRAFGIQLEQKQHPASAHARFARIAERVVDAIDYFWGTPPLVVMRRQDPGPYQKDRSAVARLGLHWAIVGALSARDIPVAELGTISATIALCGSARGGHAELASKVQTLYPTLELPRALKDANAPDPRFRISTVALALLGAVALHIPTKVEPTTHVWNALRKGGSFPSSLQDTLPEFYRPPRTRNRSAAERAKAQERVEGWGAEALAYIHASTQVDFWTHGAPEKVERSSYLRAEYTARVDQEIEALSEYTLADLESMPTPADLGLYAAVQERLASLRGE